MAVSVDRKADYDTGGGCLKGEELYMYKRLKKRRAGCAGIIVMLCLFSINAAAAEGREDILSVELPVVAEGEPSPFDFILDPGGLLYETDAMRYGGGTVEEGATLLFRNEEGEYDFSRYSDRLVIASEEREPVMVSLSASVSELDEMDLVGYEDLSESENPCMYLALTDDRGNEQPLSKEAEAVIRVELDAGVYSFGLTGACNPDADWQQVSVCPRVTVTWHIESARTEEGEEPSKDAGTEEDMSAGADEEDMPAGADEGDMSADAGEKGTSAGAAAEDASAGTVGEDMNAAEESAAGDIGTDTDEGKKSVPEDSGI